MASASWLLLAAPLSAQEKGPRLKAGEFNPAHESVEMFAAAKAELIKVRFIPKDDTQGRIIVENLNVRTSPYYPQSNGKLEPTTAARRTSTPRVRRRIRAARRARQARP